MQKQIFTVTFVIMALIFSSQAQALTPTITDIPKEAIIGDKIDFTFKILIGHDERIPMTGITLKTDDVQCAYTPEGVPVFGIPAICSEFSLTRTHYAPYTAGKCRVYIPGTTQWHCYGDCEGYGCGDGYGENYCDTITCMVYNIHWDTSTFSPGSHNIKASADTLGHTYETGEETITLSAQDAQEQTGTNSSGSSYYSSIRTGTTTIQIKETPRLEIISITIPETMLPDTHQNITITIRNNGNVTCKVNTTLDILNITRNQTKEIDAKEQSTYTYSVGATIHDPGDHIARISIQSGAKMIEREIVFTVKEEEAQYPQQKNRTYTTILFRYNNRTGTITLTGCLKETIQNPQITIGNTVIPLKKDQKNCFNTKISTTSLSSGSHMLEVKDDMRTLYTKQFTVPEKAHQNSPSGNIIQNSSYIIPFILLAPLILFPLLIARKKQKNQG